MSHESLIARLARAGTPVTPLASPNVRAARWLLLAIGSVAVGVTVRGLRANWAAATMDPGFLVTVGLILAIGLAAAVLALATAVPGVVRTTWMRWVPLVLLGVWGGVLGLDVLMTGSPLIEGQVGAGCMWKTYGIAVGPAATLVWLAGRAAPLDWRWTGGLAALAALAFGVLGTELICPIAGTAHLFSWHFLPVAGMSAAAFAVAALLAKRRG